MRAARYLALPSKTALSPRYHRSLSTMITELDGAPRGTADILMEIASQQFVLPVQPNASAELAGRRVLFTMSKDNDLGWIREWARYHVALHGADAVLLFDNGSSRYATAEIEDALLSVNGLAKIAVASWPYRYGATDNAVRNNPYYALFAQVSAMSVALRRYASMAEGLLNCDIDELAATPANTNVFELACQARHGLLVMEGQFVEAEPEAGAPAGSLTHRNFQSRLRDPALRLSRPRKWVLDPSRPWVQSLAVHPYMHWIKGRPWFGKTQSDAVFYWHFRGINTNWKDNRTQSGHLLAAAIEKDDAFAAAIRRLPPIPPPATKK